MERKLTKTIEARLGQALADLNRDISEKKFRKHLRKAGRILKDGLALPKASANGKD